MTCTKSCPVNKPHVNVGAGKGVKLGRSDIECDVLINALLGAMIGDVLLDFGTPTGEGSALNRGFVNDTFCSCATVDYGVISPSPAFASAA